ncbi:MAG: protocatechuate 3,4-dioxygenase subunit alpha [Alphaproteobacteria bacterium]|nr:protocatechuate 3,4-dioxygenase subunit alpha [Alphaproteobacteria bacterium]
MSLKQTPSQTVGPYFAYGLTPEQYGYDFNELAGGRLVDDETEGERIHIVGRVLDGEGNAVDDAMIEIWQADAQGRYAHPADPRGSNLAFKGFGRYGTGTDPELRFMFDTIKPGSVDGQAPHITMCVMCRGMLSHAFTRIYFSDEANGDDAVLATVPEDRRATLIAEREETPAGIVYRFDVHLQGGKETVFFDL